MKATQIICRILCVSLVASVVCAEGSHSDVTVSHADPHRGVPFTQVRITDDYCAARQKLFICRTIPIGIKNVEKEHGGIPNIKNAALKNQGKAHYWYGKDKEHASLHGCCNRLVNDL